MSVENITSGPGKSAGNNRASAEEARGKRKQYSQNNSDSGVVEGAPGTLKRLSLKRNASSGKREEQTESSSKSQKMGTSQQIGNRGGAGSVVEEGSEMAYDQLMVLLQQALHEVPASLASNDKRKSRK